MINQFCYLGDMISASGKAEAITIGRVGSGWICYVNLKDGRSSDELRDRLEIEYHLSDAWNSQFRMI